MTSNTTWPPVWPPNTYCLLNDTDHSCRGFTPSVDPDMIAWLNITSIEVYKQAYCINPPPDDSCSFGYCPNPDVAGPLVRIATYITNACISILILYSPKFAQDAFWSQILSTYALLITCGISIIQSNLTHFHAAIAVVLSGSPLTLYLFGYALASFWYNKHRLNGIVGEGQLFVRLLIITAGLIWISLLIYILAGKRYTHFAQASCIKDGNDAVSYLYLLPFVAIVVLTAIANVIGAGMRAVVSFVFGMIGLTILAWIIAIVLQRKSIWRDGERWSPRFGRTWSAVGRNYPFIHFMTLVVIPMVYWISVVELGCLTQSREEFSFSFGQVLAMFVALPPLFNVSKLLPRFFAWATNLSWVVRIRKQIRRKSPHSNEDESAFNSTTNLNPNPYASSEKIEDAPAPYSPATLRTNRFHRFSSDGDPMNALDP